jgi:hypothetical protein
MQSALRSIVLFLSGSLVAASPALAQDRPATPPQRMTEAGAHFDRGASLYREGDYAAALIEFKRAYDASPTWQVLFNIGQCYFELRDYANALVTLQRFQAEGGDRIGREDRATLDAELPDLVNRVATVTVASNLDGATVSVDDQVVGKTPLSDPVLVSIGQRKIAAVHEGRTPVQQRLALAAGDAVVVHLDFAPAPTQQALVRESQTALVDRSTPPAPNHLPAYVSFIAAIGGVTMGSIFGGLAIGDKSSLDRVCMPNGACPTSAETSIQALGRDGTISTVGFGVGLACLAAGIVFWATAKPSPIKAASLRFAPGGIVGRF